MKVLAFGRGAAEHAGGKLAWCGLCDRLAGCTVTPWRRRLDSCRLRRASGGAPDGSEVETQSCSRRSARYQQEQRGSRDASSRGTVAEPLLSGGSETRMACGVRCRRSVPALGRKEEDGEDDDITNTHQVRERRSQDRLKAIGDDDEEAPTIVIVVVPRLINYAAPDPPPLLPR